MTNVMRVALALLLSLSASTARSRTSVDSSNVIKPRVWFQHFQTHCRHRADIVNGFTISILGSVMR
jgi:hypothetical protein